MASGSMAGGTVSTADGGGAVSTTDDWPAVDRNRWGGVIGGKKTC
jgi:hypothetical protein